MEYNKEDYYSSSEEETNKPQPIEGVEKKNKEINVKPVKRKMTEAKLEQLKRARETKARKRLELKEKEKETIIPTAKKEIVKKRKPKLKPLKKGNC